MSKSGNRIRIEPLIHLVEDRFETPCKGLFQRIDVLRHIDSIHSNMIRWPKVSRCLVDVREAEVELGTMGEYVIGEYAAKQLAGLRIAVIQLPGQIKGLLEDTAFNRGLRISIVQGRPAALDWLYK